MHPPGRSYPRPSAPRPASGAHRLTTPGHAARVSVLRFALAGLIAGTMNGAVFAQSNNLPPLDSPLPDTGMVALRLLSALALVLALFLGGVWCFRHWQRLFLLKGKSPKMNILEVRALGHRHALYVVGYEQQRLLLATSPTGVSLISHLPPSEESTAPAVTVSFTDALRQVLSRKT
jgi:flagellar biogenesis protein FliO